MKDRKSKTRSLEVRAERRRKRVNIENIMLSTLALTGAVTFTLMAPNALRLLKYLDLEWISKRDPRQRLHECLSRMRRKGLVRFDVNSRRYMLTNRGRTICQKAGTHRISVPRRWDGRWRAVMFDIPEKRRGLRRRIAYLLQTLGFYRLQDSVWVHPYDCEEIIALVKLEQRIGAEMRYAIIDALEYDRQVREHFQLPLRT